jgi:hypothetical protein
MLSWVKAAARCKLASNAAGAEGKGCGEVPSPADNAAVAALCAELAAEVPKMPPGVVAALTFALTPLQWGDQLLLMEALAARAVDVARASRHRQVTGIIRRHFDFAPK